MGTRSTVKFYQDEAKKELILSVYQQYDGYIEGVGFDLAKWLKSKTVINGIGVEQTMQQGFANGMGCLCAQYVAENKTKVGGFYLTTSDDEQEYNYSVSFLDGKFFIEVGDFKGSPDELLLYKG